MDEFDRTKQYFENHAEDYAETIMAIQPLLYKNMGKIINRNVSDGDNVLDIGNGGIVNYDYKRMNRLVCADLYVSELAQKKYKDEDNVDFVKGDILNLTQEESLRGYKPDVIIVQTVIHHLARGTYRDTVANVEKAIRECMEMLECGGRLVILESTVTAWFEKIERIMYPLMQLFFRVCKFGAVYQFSSKSLYRLISNMGLEIKESEEVELDKYVWIMNCKVSSKLTPCGLTYYLIEKK